MRTLGLTTATKLFATGFTVGPIVDSLHNQCLLKYEVLPITLPWPRTFHHNQDLLTEVVTGFDGRTELVTSGIIGHNEYLFCSSWTVPPLLGFAYVVLGGVLPRIVESAVGSKNDPLYEGRPRSVPTGKLRSRALLAVTTTALIIKLSEFLETHPDVFHTFNLMGGNSHSIALLVMAAAAGLQWALLDGSFSALLVATVTGLGGPLTELPFVGHGVWTYLDSAANYFPLQHLPSDFSTLISTGKYDSFSHVLEIVFGTSSYRDLGLSSITGPCYFAVAMDAIALGRWFDSSTIPAPHLSSSTKINSDSDI